MRGGAYLPLITSRTKLLTMGDYADWAIEDSIWGDPIEGRRTKFHTHKPSNPPKIKFRGKTPQQYMEFIGIPAGYQDNLLLEFETKYPSNGVKLTAKFKKDILRQKYWSRFLSYCQQFKPT